MKHPLEVGTKVRMNELGKEVYGCGCCGGNPKSKIGVEGIILELSEEHTFAEGDKTWIYEVEFPELKDEKYENVFCMFDDEFDVIDE